MRVFLSYHTPDHDVARALEAGLLARGPGLEIYFPPRCLSAGAYWLPALSEQIGRSDVVLLLTGKRIGPWQELEYFEAMNLGRQAANGGRPRIVPVVMSDRAPGLPFFALLHQIWTPNPVSSTSLDTILNGVRHNIEAKDELPWRRFQPYKGLAALREQDAAFFVGRETETSAVLDALVNAPDKIITLIGASGSGKSSLARAGVLAALQSQIPPLQDRSWPAGLADSRSFLALVMRPGAEPLRELALACAKLYVDRSFDIDTEAAGWNQRFLEGGRFRDLLREMRTRITERAGDGPPRRFILYIDQAEEMYTRAAPQECDLFGRLVSEAAAQDDVSVLVSLRADFYASFQQDPHLFARAVRIDVLPMSEATLAEAIRRPTTQLAARFESSEMPARIAAAAAREPGALPLLSDYMHDLWLAMQARDDGVLRWSDVLAGEGISAPLIHRAEAFMARADTDQAAVHRLFTLRLAHVPTVGEPVRRVARRGECSAAEWRIADVLASEAWRLLTLSTRPDTDESCAEVAHEQLLRSWPRLADWLKVERNFLAWKAVAEQAAARYWETPDADRRQAALMGQSLTIARGWHGSRGTDLALDLARFIEASIAEDDRAAASRAETERRLVEAELAAARLAREKAEADHASAEARLRRAKMRMAGAAAAAVVGCFIAGAGYVWLRDLQRLRADRDTAGIIVSAFFPSGLPASADEAVTDGREVTGETKIMQAVSYLKQHPNDRQLLVAVQILLDMTSRDAILKGDATGGRDLVAQRVALARAADTIDHDATSGLLLGNSLIALGDAALASGDAAAAADAFAQALQAFRSTPSDDPARLRGLAQSKDRLGLSASHAGNFKLARGESSEAVRAFADLSEQQPHVLDLQRDYATALSNAAIAASGGQPDALALSIEQHAVDVRRMILARNPNDFADRLALAKNLLLLVALTPSGTADPGAWLREGHVLAEQLVNDARDAASRREDVADSSALLAQFTQIAPKADTP